MPDKNKYIEEFERATPIWYEEILDKLKEKDCVLCGVNPKKLFELSKALTAHKAEVREEIKKDMIIKMNGWHGTGKAMVEDYFQALARIENKPNQ